MFLGHAFFSSFFHAFVFFSSIVCSSHFQGQDPVLVKHEMREISLIRNLGPLQIFRKSVIETLQSWALGIK